MNVNQIIQNFAAWYGSGADGSCPTSEQWRHVLSAFQNRPITLINFFKLRGEAYYNSEGTNKNFISGEVAFSNYAAVSIPAMERAGGQFLFVGPYQGAFIGADENWDIIAIGSYSGLDALLALHNDEEYRAAYHHRTAACEMQKVLLGGA